MELHPLTVEDLRLPGPPIRVADIVQITGYSARTVIRDIEAYELVAFQRYPGAQYRIQRDAAIEWIERLERRVPRGVVGKSGAAAQHEQR